MFPIGFAIFGGDRFRYPCQDPANWEKDVCKRPLCESTGTCPDYLIKPIEEQNKPIPAIGVNNCGK